MRPKSSQAGSVQSIISLMGGLDAWHYLQLFPEPPGLKKDCWHLGKFERKNSPSRQGTGQEHQVQLLPSSLAVTEVREGMEYYPWKNSAP